MQQQVPSLSQVPAPTLYVQHMASASYSELPANKTLKAEEGNTGLMDHQDPRETQEQTDQQDSEAHKAHQACEAHRVQEAQEVQQECLLEPQVTQQEEGLHSEKKSRHPISQSSADPRKCLEYGYPKEIIGTVIAKPDTGVNHWDEYPPSTLRV